MSSCYVNIADLTKDYWNYVQLPSPVQTDGSFFVAYQVNYVSPADTFALYQVHDRTDGGTNTAWYNDGSYWYQYTNAGLNTSLGISTHVCSTDQATGTFVLLSPINNIQSVPEALSNEKEISIYPNPARDVISVDFGSTPDGSYHVTVSDLSGKTMKVINGNSHTGSTISIGIQDLNASVYFVRLDIAGQPTLTKKVTVIR